MMKRYFTLLMGAIVFMSCIFSGCGQQTAENPTSSEEESTLSVYVVKTDALYVNAVNSYQEQAKDLTLNVTTFESYEAMFDVMNVELMSKGGPDVVLYNSVQSEIDGYKLAQSGMFLPLDEFVEQLDPTIYPKALMDAGNIAGKQYFIPFSYNLICTFTSEQRMTEKGYSPEDNVYEMLLHESDSLMSLSDKVPTTMMIYRPDPINTFIDCAGVKLFDNDTGDMVVDRAELEEICRFVKLNYDNQEKKKMMTNQFANDFAGAADSFTFFTESFAFMNNFRYYQAMFSKMVNSPMVAMPFHKLHNTQEFCPYIVCFGGVNANTKSPEKAYELLKYILDYKVSNSWPKYEESGVYYAPISLEAYQAAVVELSEKLGYGPVTVLPLTEENAEQLTEISRKITDAVIPNSTLGVGLQEILDPYFHETDSFDNCYNALLNRLQIYLSE